METTIDAGAGTRTRRLPPGVNGSLWDLLPQCGVVEFRGRPLTVQVDAPTDVLFPTDCGLSLLAALDGDRDLDPMGRTVLDVGSGSGLYTVAMLSAGAAHVTALDVNASAAEVARDNVRRNLLDVDRLTCVTSDLATYQPGRQVDLIVTNPPHLPYDPEYSSTAGLETALVAGRDGRALYDVVVGRVDDLLAPGGSLLMAHSSLTGVPRTVDEMERKGYTARTLEIFDMDIPLLAYAEHKDAMLRNLHDLRAQGSADFTGDRFAVHVIEFRRPVG